VLWKNILAVVMDNVLLSVLIMP